MGERGAPPRRRAGAAGRRARSARQALRRSGMVDRTSTSTSSSRPISSPPTGREHLVDDAERARPGVRQKAEFYMRQLVNAVSPSNFVFTNPELLRDHAQRERRESRARHPDARRGHRRWRRRAQNPPVRCLEVRGRPQSRDHARQGDLPERADAAHPIRAVDREGAAPPAADRAAVDQQVLRARPHAGEILHPLVRRQRASPCSSSPGSIPTRTSPRRASRSTCARARWTRST